MTRYSTITQRIHAQVLARFGWDDEAIEAETELSLRQVSSNQSLLLKRKLTCQVVYWKIRPPKTKRKAGRPRKITLAMEEELVKFIISNRSTQFMALFEVPITLAWDVSEACVRDALRLQGFHRRHARIKPLLSQKHREECLKWASEKLDWDINK